MDDHSSAPKASAALVDLAQEITQAMHANGGKLESYDIPLDRWVVLHKDQAEYFGGSAVCLPYDRANFVWRGVPVCSLPARQ